MGLNAVKVNFKAGEILYGSENSVTFGYKRTQIQFYMSKQKLTTLPLKEYPVDVRKYVLKVQGEIKAEKGISQYSLCKTIYKIIREHKEFSKLKNLNNDRSSSKPSI